MNFIESAKDFVRNPLGIIALFISLIYGFATLLLSSSADKLTSDERYPIIIFIVLFPVLVLFTFFRLVTNHHGKLYAPSDYKDDSSFLTTLSDSAREDKINDDISDALGGKPLEDIEQSTIVPPNNKNKAPISMHKIREEIQVVENKVVQLLEQEFKIKAERNIGISNTGIRFDGLFENLSEKFVGVEVKLLKQVPVRARIFNHILEQAVIADKFFNSNFKMIIVLVYDFDKNEFDKIISDFEKKIEASSTKIELRTYAKRDLF